MTALLLQLLLEQTRAPVRQRDYDLKLDASRRADAAFAAVRAVRGLEEGRIDLVNDPAGTGLIGPEFSLITNARGNLEAKLTSANPNFAGLLVQYFRQAGLKAGDPVAVAISGSFPGLNISLYAALETLDLNPVVITSIGASMWGANDPAFTWLDMEALFAQRGIFTTRSAAATYGGGNDMGRGLSPQGRRLIAEAAARNGIQMLPSQNIEDAIARRMAFYSTQRRGHSYRMYVNIGGGVASIGSSHNRLLLPTGLFQDLGEHNWARKGTMVLFAEQGVPVIHMLSIADLARKHGLPVAPDYQPLPGEGEIFEREMYRFPLAATVFVLYTLACVLILAPEIRGGLFDRLTRRRARRATGALAVLFLLVLSPAAQARSSWRTVSPQISHGSVCLNSDGAEFEYHLVHPDQPVVFEVTGPRRCKLVTRYLGEISAQNQMRYGITVELDGQEVQVRQHRIQPAARTVTCDQTDPVGTLRRTYIDVGRGRHRIAIVGVANEDGRIGCRLFRQVKRRARKQVPLTPSSYLGVATLQFESGNQSKYYRCNSGDPIVLDLTGPTELEVTTRLDFGSTSSGFRPYTMQLTRDGQDLQTFHLTAEKQDGAQWVESPELMPGTRQILHITVPRGRHRYEMLCVRPDACDVAVKFRIPEDDLESRP